MAEVFDISQYQENSEGLDIDDQFLEDNVYRWMVFYRWRKLMALNQSEWNEEEYLSCKKEVGKQEVTVLLALLDGHTEYQRDEENIDVNYIRAILDLVDEVIQDEKLRNLAARLSLG